MRAQRRGGAGCKPTEGWSSDGRCSRVLECEARVEGRRKQAVEGRSASLLLLSGAQANADRAAPPSGVSR